MTSRLLQLWRALLGAVGFAAFAAFALTLGWIALPLDRRLRPRGADLRAQRAIHRGSRAYLALVEALGVLRIEVDGAERLRAPGARVVVANHPTLFDVILLCSLAPQLDCIVKASWARNPFLRGLVGSADYVCGDAVRHVLRECVRRVEAGRSLLVFPEGTRSPRGGLGPFHRGAAHIARAAGAPMVPVLIRCHPPILSKGQKWYDLAARPVRVCIRVGDEMQPGPFGGSARASEASRKLTSELREVFEKGMELVDVGA